MLNPLSAITASPSSSLSNKPLLSVMYLSLTFPVHSFETKLKYHGVIPTSAFIVLCCLKLLCALGEVGFCKKPL